MDSLNMPHTSQNHLVGSSSSSSSNSYVFPFAKWNGHAVWWKMTTSRPGVLAQKQRPPNVAAARAMPPRASMGQPPASSTYTMCMVTRLPPRVMQTQVWVQVLGRQEAPQNHPNTTHCLHKVAQLVWGKGSVECCVGELNAKMHQCKQWLPAQVAPSASRVEQMYSSF